MANIKHGGLSAFLNANSQQGSTLDHVNDIQRIPIEEIQNNAKNFYGLRDIDGLANTIALTKFVDPLIVMENPNAGAGEGKYLLVAGHRRKAAWQKLLDSGRAEDHTLPCIVRRFEPRTIKMADGTEKEISAERMAEAFLMFSNMGQRKYRTINEKLHEVEALEPLARDLYDSKEEKDGFRPFFATQILGIGNGTLQRLLALKKLTERAKEAVDNGEISTSLGSELATLPPEEQDAWLDKIANGEVKGTFAAIADYKKSLHEQGADSEPAEPVVPQDDDTEAAEPVTDTDDEPVDEPDTDEHPMFPEDAPEPEDEDDTDYTKPLAGDDEPADLPAEPQVKKAPVSKEGRGLIVDIADVPRNVGSDGFQPQKEATDWRKQQVLQFIEETIAYCEQKMEENAGNELVQAQWNLRKSAMQVEKVIQEKRNQG